MCGTSDSALNKFRPLALADDLQGLAELQLRRAGDKHNDMGFVSSCDRWGRIRVLES